MGRGTGEEGTDMDEYDGRGVLCGRLDDEGVEGGRGSHCGENAACTECEEGAGELGTRNQWDGMEIARDKY